ncbi:MAG TPA: diacylglycerol kinase family protein [Candidatus Saccharimonadales bacterium]|jgi:diacylglycerol kinase (ATP)|nr:diacylglycerol kinase family protein [Candidatus Saccharimonadales bacterium]
MPAAPMHKAIFIFNPSSGRKQGRRAEKIARCAEIFRAAGVAAELCATTHAGSATGQARAAAESGFDTVIACGGDGTVNECLNGLMHAQSHAALGVIPLGSGNLLATDLGLSTEPEEAARALLRYQPRSLKPGLISYQENGETRQRYFIVAAGVGVDADLMYRTGAEAKGRLGIYAYFSEMARMTLRREFPMFMAEWNDEQGIAHTAKVALVMALRPRRFPGLLRRVKLGSDLERNDYRLLLFRTGKARHFLNFFASLATGLNWKVPQVDVVYSTWLRCTPTPLQDPKSIHAEIDGEVLGTLPVEISVEERTFDLLMKEANSH